MSVLTESNGAQLLSSRGDPTWEIALLFPEQGQWSETDYFALKTKRLVELDDGFLEVLPMPTLLHQAIVGFLHWRLTEFLARWGKGGHASFAPVPIRLWPLKLREPDVFYISKEHLGDLRQTPEKIDMAMEVVSEGDESRVRDYTTKRTEYAKARIPEYWIVDPREGKIIVLVLDGEQYREHGVFSRGEKATSALLPGFEISVDECFRAAGA